MRGQAISGTSGSVTSHSSGTLPVFVTRNVQVSCSPTGTIGPVGTLASSPFTDFTMAIPGSWPK